MLKRMIGLITLATLTQTAFADDTHVYRDTTYKGYKGFKGEVVPAWNYVATLSAGAVWTDNLPEEDVQLGNQILKTYTIAENNDPIFEGEAFFGIQTRINPMMLGQFGLAVVATSSAEFEGDVWDDGNPAFNNFEYEYDIQHTALNAKGKVLFDTQTRFMPWVSASLGVAWNDSHNFNDEPTIYQAVKTPDYDDHTETAFTYNVGLGVDYVYNFHCHFGLGYEFADWGKNKLGHADGQTTSDTPSHDHLYTNGLLLSFTYIV